MNYLNNKDEELYQVYITCNCNIQACKKPLPMGETEDGSLARRRTIPSNGVNIHKLSVAILCVGLGYIFQLSKWWHLCWRSNSDGFRENVVAAGICGCGCFVD